MKTQYWLVDHLSTNLKDCPQIFQAAQLLKQNEVVAFPTETVYGLGANAKSDEAVAKIYEAKGRPSDNPLIIHISKKEQLKELVGDHPEWVDLLIERFWPGPLTLVLPKKAGLSDMATAGLPTVGVRMPNHPVALALIEAAGLPIAAPSANLSGKPSPTSARHVLDDLDGRIAGIIDGGVTGVGVESTVLDCSEENPVILRPGSITKQQLEELIGNVRLDQALLDRHELPKAPGMKYAHYAPEAPMFIVEGSSEFLQSLVAKEKEKGKRVGVLTTEENESFYTADKVIACGKRSNLQAVANSLYHSLRKFNEDELDVIFSESFPQEGIGQAIMNRLLKAASHRVIKQ